MQSEALEYFKRCSRCQMHAPMLHQPGGNLTLISSPWLFTQWRLDIIESFPKASGNRWYVIVATDYFMKWVKAEALANIWDVDVKKFVWKNIITRFGVPRALVSDNGLQFNSKVF